MPEEPDERIDLAPILAWMETQGVGRGPIEDVRWLSGGTQNLMIGFRRGAERLVLRAPPRHAHARGLAMIERESTVLRALAGSDVPHAAFIACCLDDEPLGRPFYLMAQVDGFNASTGLPPRHAADPALRRRMGLAFVEGAARLGRIDPAAAGIAELGKAEEFLARQSGRWRRELDGYARHAAWPGPAALGDVDRIAGWLTRHCPEPAAPGLLHGDLHLANVLFSPHDGELAALIDWELATIGDPLLDLGWIIATWPDPRHDEPGIIPVEPWSGFPAIDTLAPHYAAHSDRSIDRIDWYVVLACYKLGILLEGSHARSCAGLIPSDTGEELHRRARALFGRARRLID